MHTENKYLLNDILKEEWPVTAIVPSVFKGNIPFSFFKRTMLSLATSRAS